MIVNWCWSFLVVKEQLSNMCPWTSGTLACISPWLHRFVAEFEFKIWP